MVLIFFVSVGLSTSFAQDKSTDFDPIQRRTAHLTEKLDLDESQIVEVEAILRNSKRPDHDLIRAERHSEKVKMTEAIKAVLNEDQIVKFTEIKTEKGQHASRRGHHERHRSESRQHRKRDPEINTKLLEMRLSLEESISDEDKDLIAQLRSVKKERKPEHSNRKARKLEPRKSKKSDNHPRSRSFIQEHEEAKTLAIKYGDKIERIFEENKSFFAEKRKDGRKSEDAQRKKRHRDHHRIMKENQDSTDVNDARVYIKESTISKRHLRKHIDFLLLELTEMDDSPSSGMNSKNSISIAPNPSQSASTLEYMVNEAGNIKIELVNEMGQVSKILLDEYKEQGNYRLMLDTGSLESNIYFVTLNDGRNIVTERLVIQK